MSLVFLNQNKTTKVSADIEINASAKEVWHVISTPGHLSYCHPFCHSNDVEKWDGVGSIDRIKYYNGLLLTRIFTQWDESKGYELIIGRGAYASAKVKWELKSLDSNLSELKISINMQPSIILKKYPRISQILLTKLYLVPQMKRYVQSVVNGFKFFLEKGTPVTKNQFGNHKMFSTK